MALYLNVPNMKTVRDCYAGIGLSNSAVLDQIRIAISANHFKLDDILEMIEIVDEWSKVITSQGDSIPAQVTKAHEQLTDILKIMTKAGK